MEKKPFEPANLLIILVPLILIVAVCVFLFTTGDGGITGLQALALQNTSFWLWTVVCWVLALMSGVALYKVRFGDSLLTKIVLSILLIGLLTAPFGKACTVKADPVSAPKVQPL